MLLVFYSILLHNAYLTKEERDTYLLHPTRLGPFTYSIIALICIMM
jgi:hypothetical protein